MPMARRGSENTLRAGYMSTTLERVIANQQAEIDLLKKREDAHLKSWSIQTTSESLEVAK